MGRADAHCFVVTGGGRSSVFHGEILLTGGGVWRENWRQPATPVTPLLLLGEDSG